ncbi:MAG: hypothetical protein OEW11_04550 [Nitrospirota bacterium]|nr:hypothetical protein [Nitrospirota bacterium]
MAHPDCCGGDDDRDPLACPVCGERGHGVDASTATSFVPAVHLDEAGGGGFWFCDTPGCAVAYYPPGGTPVFAGEIDIAVGIKSPDPAALWCYCFGITRQAVRERMASTDPASAEIARRIRAEGCDCVTKNPSGQCCLGAIRALEAG